jgi:predicted RNase H-like HicB family nuclease
MGRVKIQFHLTCTVREDPDTESFVSHCPALGVFSAGNTELEALEAIKSALAACIPVLYEQDRLRDKLIEGGFFPTREIVPDAKEFLGVEVGNETLQMVEVDVPLYLIADNAQRMEPVVA